MVKNFIIIERERELSALEWFQLDSNNLDECPKDILDLHYIVSYRGYNPFILPTYPRYTLEEISAIQSMPQWSPSL